jgi:hypothetical protein
MAIFAVVILAVVALAWIPILGLGIVLLRRSRKVPGILLTVFGGIWGVAALGIACFAAFVMWQYSRIGGGSESFDPETYEGAKGTLVLNWDGEADARVISGETQYVLSGSGGRLAAPAGDLTVTFLGLRSAGNEPWTAALFAPGYRFDVSVPADGEAKIPVGPPFRAEIKVGTAKREEPVRLNLAVSDSSGWKASIVAPGRRKLGFKIVDSSGRVLETGDFEYG